MFDIIRLSDGHVIKCVSEFLHKEEFRLVLRDAVQTTDAIHIQHTHSRDFHFKASPFIFVGLRDTS